MPNCIEDYVHRIGRTGRAGEKGLAYSFFTNKDLSIAPDIVKIIENSEEKIPD